MTNNPLLQKYEELYGKKEPPKMPRIEDYEGEETIADELKKTNIIKGNNAKVNVKPSRLSCFDSDATNDAFFQFAQKIKDGTAKVANVSIELDSYGNFSYGKKITFEVYDYGP